MVKKDFDPLPQFYDDNLIGFFSQGPGVVYVYWELSGSQWEAVADLAGLVLIRLYRVVDGDGFDCLYLPVAEVEPPPGTGNWYFRGLDPGSAYSCEIGCRLPDGSFFSLIKSDQLTTPPVPRFGPTSGEKDLPARTGAGPPETSAANTRAEITGPIPGLSEILVSMPFYMGYDTQSTGQ